MNGNWVGSAWRGLLEIFVPPVCALCGEHPPEADAGFCTNCLAGVRRIATPHCPICGLPFQGAGPSHPCTHCLKKPPPFERIAAYGVYEGRLRDAIRAIKYGGNLAVRAALEEFFWEGCRETWGTNPPFSAVVSVPCHTKTLRKRGLDLPALLSRRAAREWDLAWLPDALTKTDGDVHMAKLDLDKRREAVRSLYAPRLALSGRVLVVDDVVTTTATTRATARACLSAGAEAVEVAALARTPLAPSRK